MTLDRDLIHESNLRRIDGHRKAMEWMAKDFAKRAWNLETLFDDLKKDAVLALAPAHRDPAFPETIKALHLLTRMVPAAAFPAGGPWAEADFSPHRLGHFLLPGGTPLPDLPENNFLVLENGASKPVSASFTGPDEILAHVVKISGKDLEKSPYSHRCLWAPTPAIHPSALVSLERYTRARLVERLFRQVFPGQAAAHEGGNPTAAFWQVTQIHQALLAAEFRLRSGGALDPFTTWSEQTPL